MPETPREIPPATRASLASTLGATRERIFFPLLSPPLYQPVIRGRPALAGCPARRGSFLWPEVPVFSNKLSSRSRVFSAVLQQEQVPVVDKWLMIQSLWEEESPGRFFATTHFLLIHCPSMGYCCRRRGPRPRTPCSARFPVPVRLVVLVILLVTFEEADLRLFNRNRTLRTI